MPPKNGYIAAGAVTAGLLVAGGLSAASAATGSTTTAPSSSYSVQDSGPRGEQGNRPAPHQHTAVDEAQTASIKEAVKAKDSTITVNDVKQDPDGSFDVHGTKAGKPVMLEVSKDLQTITEHEGPRGKGGPGKDGRGPRHTPVSEAQAAKVKEAVKAKDSTITVNDVHQGPNGEFHARGTKDGKEVHLHISKDLKTITEHEGPRGKGGPGHGGPRDGRDGGARDGGTDKQQPQPSQSGGSTTGPSTTSPSTDS